MRNIQEILSCFTLMSTEGHIQSDANREHREVMFKMFIEEIKTKTFHESLSDVIDSKLSSQQILKSHSQLDNEINVVNEPGSYFTHDCIIPPDELRDLENDPSIYTEAPITIRSKIYPGAHFGDRLLSCLIYSQLVCIQKIYSSIELQKKVPLIDFVKSKKAIYKKRKNILNSPDIFTSLPFIADKDFIKRYVSTDTLDQKESPVLTRIWWGAFERFLIFFYTLSPDLLVSFTHRELLQLFIEASPSFESNSSTIEESKFNQISIIKKKYRI